MEMKSAEKRLKTFSMGGC